MYVQIDTQLKSVAYIARELNNNSVPGICYTLPTTIGRKVIAYHAHAQCRKYAGYQAGKIYRSYQSGAKLYIADLTPMEQSNETIK